MKFLKSLMKLDPFVILGVCVILSSSLLFVNNVTGELRIQFVFQGQEFLFSIPKYREYYYIGYVILANTIGCSIRTNLKDLYYLVRNKMCLYTYVSISGLLCLSVYDIINIIRPLENFYAIYNTIIAFVFFIMATILLIKSKMNNE